MSIGKGIARAALRRQKKARPHLAPRLWYEESRAYLGVPCTASVTTARVSDGASISRKV